MAAAGGKVRFRVSNGVAYIISGTVNRGVDNVDAVYAIEAATGQVLWAHPVSLDGRVYDLDIQVKGGVVYAAIYAGQADGQESQLSEKILLYAIQR